MRLRNTNSLARRAAARRPRRGFAFTEILFAVMVLALGFIMIAAMFPVTIRQTQSTMEEATAANVAKGAMDYLQGIASEDFFPVTLPPINPTAADPDPKLNAPAEVVSLTQVYYKHRPGMPAGTKYPAAWGNGTTGVLPAYYAVRGNFIDPRNPRIAWIPLYRRTYGSPFAQVFIVVVQSRNQDQYVSEMDRTGAFPARTYSDLDPPPGTPAGQPAYSTLEPRRIVVGVEWDNLLKRGVATIDPRYASLAAPGAYLIIASDPNDRAKPTQPNLTGQANGRIYQLGNAIDEAAGTWELAPGTDMIRSDPTDQTKVQVGDDYDLPPVFPEDAKKSTIAYIVGRGYANPANAAEGYSGPAQEIGVYTGFIHIPTAPAN